MMKKPDFNYHTHTYRCGHAGGLDREYVEAAIKNGFIKLGFTDHVMIPGIVQRGMRGDFEMLGDYLSSIARLKKQYEDQIELHVGMEAEYSEGRIADYYRDLLASGSVEYLILGQHCYFIDNRGYWYGTLGAEQGLRRYTKDIIDGIKSGLFTYVCHPDLFVHFYQKWDRVAALAAGRIARAAKEAGMPLELNLGPSRIRDRSVLGEDPEYFEYPYAPFWEVVRRVGCDVVIGVDAHDPANFAETDYEWALRFAKKHKLKLVSKIEFSKRWK